LNPSDLVGYWWKRRVSIPKHGEKIFFLWKWFKPFSGSRRLLFKAECGLFL